MSKQKLSSQVGHVIGGLGAWEPGCDIVVLKASDARFKREVEAHPNCFVQIDKGLTEVEAGTQTAAGWVEEEKVEDE